MNYLHGIARRQGPQLHLYIWAEYIDPAIYSDFKKETGITIIEDNFSSNEELEIKLKGGALGYDIAVPSNYMVERLIEAKLLAELPKDSIPNLQFLEKRFRHPVYDPEGSFSVPYLWGTTGIAYNAKKVLNPPRTWAEFFSPLLLKDLEKRVSLVDDPRDAIGAALQSCGYSFNSTVPSELEKAKEVIAKALPYIGRLDSNSYRDLLGAGDLWLTQAYTGDIIKLRQTNPDIEFFFPTDGGSLWVDNIVILKSSERKELAAKFINFIMRRDIILRIAKTTGYATTHAEANSFLRKKGDIDPLLFPEKFANTKLEWMKNLGEKLELYDQIWTSLKSEIFEDH